MSGRKIVYREYVRTVLQQGSSKSPLRVSYASIWGADLQTNFSVLKLQRFHRCLFRYKLSIRAWLDVDVADVGF